MATAPAAMETGVISPETTGDDDVVFIVIVDIVATFDWFKKRHPPPDDTTPPYIAATKGEKRHQTQLSILNGIAIGRIQWVEIVMNVIEMIIVTMMMRRRVAMR